MILNAIKSYWDSQKNDRPAGHIGMSAIGMCSRRLAYMHHEIPGIPLDWRAKIIFDIGNLYHKQLRKVLADGLTMTQPCTALIREEEEVRLGILTGHIDGVLAHDPHCENEGHKSTLLEVKSMNERGFTELKKTGELSKDYRAQTSAYLRSTGYASATMLIANKNTGDMLSMQYSGNSELLD